MVNRQRWCSATLCSITVLMLHGCSQSSTSAPDQDEVSSSSNDVESAQEPQVPTDLTPGILTVGDQAPAFTASHWFRGEPRDAVAPDRVTLVEFWATWCGPCIAVMPHISEMASNYGPRGFDVVAVSMDRGENAHSLVDAFLVEHREIVEFDVMLDEGTTSREWFEAAGRTGIPSSFVVAQDGRIAWIGHPSEPATTGEGTELDRVVQSLLDGTFDLDAQVTAAAEAASAAAEEASRQAEIKLRVDELTQEMGTLWSAGDRRGVLEYIDQIVDLQPEQSRDLAQRKIEILLYELGESTEALESAQSMLDGPYRDDSMFMLTLAAMFSGAADPGPPGRAFAVSTAEQVVAMTDGTEPQALAVLAEAHFAAGEPARAADTLEAALGLVDPSSPAHQTFEMILERYRSAAEPPAPGEG